MAVDLNLFLASNSSRQVDLLKGEEFSRMEPSARIRFLKNALKTELPAPTTVCALCMLKELNYPDRYYFRKFLYHIDKSVADAAREAIRECGCSSEQPCNTIVHMLEEGKTDDRLLLANYFLEDKGKLNEQVLISFLSVDDRKVRENIVRKVSQEHEMNEAVLSKSISKGTAWYVRAALVEILGKRKSLHLFDCIEHLIQDKNVEVKLKLIQALSNYEQDQRKAYLQKLTFDSLIWVRKEAKRALALY